jgi:hypothetical protein
MAHLVKDQTGKIHSFPDSATPQQIASALKVKYKESDQNTDKHDDILSTLKNKAKQVWNQPAGLIDPLHIIKAGLMGLGEAGQNIGELAAPLRKYIPEKLKFAPQIDFSLPENAPVSERLAHGIGQYAPLIAVSPISLPAKGALRLIGSGLRKFIGETGAGAAYGATQSPEDRTLGAEVGGGSSAGFNILEQIIKSKSPWVKTAAKALLGGTIGAEQGGAEGAVEGAIGVPFAHKLLKKAGFIGNPAEEVISRINPKEVAIRSEAANRLGTPITPGEASARPDIIALESTIGKKGNAASERVKIGQQRIAQQKEAINNLYKQISPDSKIASFAVRKAIQDSIKKMEDARQEAVDPYYKKAYENKVSPDLIENLKNSDANISIAIKEAMEDPKYQVEGELLGVPENSIKMLDYAKRKIDAKITQAQNFGDNDAVRVLTASKNKLLNKIERFSPEYKKARKIYNELSKPIEEVENSQIGQISRLKDISLKNVSKNIFDPSQTDINVLRNIKSHVQKENPEAWDNIVKNEMNRLMTHGRRGGITGRSFFDNVLSNENRFEQFQVALEHNPQALQQLNDMKTAWEHLINIETPRTAAGQSKTSMNMARSSFEAFVNAYNNLMGEGKHIKALNYLYSTKWQKDLEKIVKLPEKERKPMMSILLGKIIAPSYVLDTNKKESQGS